ncbi:hypothetical protein [Candidatus Formimonas warabiya]|uniref:Uncharacterized protein n=1 Tax=Formimonas warabiya TaxID=1761012 RepID=A0A3G1KT01_FORW1|nr:hypothetical protein [Candidatus Formimonas warabiya]ATW25579.1 hypothetical protein DCMF_13155 [Candidatus Formimonas warabiya]
MVFSNDLNDLLRDTLEQLNLGRNGKTQSEGTDGGTTQESGGPRPSPSGILVVAGILGGVLEVSSILVDTEQLVQIVLVGSLKSRTTQAEPPSIEDFINTLLGIFPLE